MTLNGNYSFDRKFRASNSVKRFEVRLVRSSDNNCVNIDSGAYIGNSTAESCWSDRTFSYHPLDGFFDYSTDWNINPSQDLTNWTAGEYKLYVRAWGWDDQLSNTLLANFELVQPVANLTHLRCFTFNK
jgi:hypothetical protein